MKLTASSSPASRSPVPTPTAKATIPRAARWRRTGRDRPDSGAGSGGVHATGAAGRTPAARVGAERDSEVFPGIPATIRLQPFSYDLFTPSRATLPRHEHDLGGLRGHHLRDDGVALAHDEQEGNPPRPS